MTCCGKARAALFEKNSEDVLNAPSVHLTFAGVRAIVVSGAVTGHVYRFVPGSTLRVHGGDAASMRHIPGLRPQSTGI